MAQTYTLSPGRKFFNRLMTAGLRVGIAPKANSLLTVAGRSTGTPHSTPVSLVTDQGGTRWLVSPYGDVSWVRNARAAGRVTLSRGRRHEAFAIEELSPDAAAPVLRTYLSAHPIVRPFFDVTPDSPLDAYIAEAPRHPVFRLTPSL